MTGETYWKIRACAALVELATLHLHQATEQYHALLEANGLASDRALRFDDLRQIIQEHEHGVPDRDR